MATFKMPESFFIAYGGIDEQHEAIIDGLNACMETSDPEIFLERLAVVADDFKAHFANEEKLMADLGFERLEVHIQKHQDLLDSITTVTQDVRSTGIVETASILSCLKEFIDVVAFEDLKFREFLDGKGLLEDQR